MATPLENLAGLRERLKADPQALPWPERRVLAQALGQRMQREPPTSEVLELVALLANDPKSEVRLDVATLLVWLPESAFVPLAARLSQDGHAYVARAAERALERRRRGEDEERRREMGQSQVGAEYTAFEKRYGPEAARQAWALAERLYDLNVGAMAHNLRGLITPLLMDVNMLQEHQSARRLEPAELVRVLRRMKERAEWAVQMIQDMRDYSRLPAQARGRERLAVLLHEAAQAAQAELRRLGQAPNAVELVLEAPDELTVLAARESLVIAFTNLLQNAYEAFTPELLKRRRGCIKVQAREVEPGWAEIALADNGRGMDAEELAIIRTFAPGRKTMKRFGTGLGLPIASRYIALHGGRLRLESRENKGTVVTVHLPTREATEET